MAKRITVPFLAIQGTEDNTVVPETAEKIVAALVNSPDAEIYSVEGAGHNQPEQLEEITMVTSPTWFLMTL